VSDVYAAVEAIALSTSLPTVTICDVLEVSRSAYYDWLAREPGTREPELDELTPAIVEIFVRHRRRYGARRTRTSCAAQGESRAS
jgi:putative transposase